jgi:hypothetical protein
MINGKAMLNCPVSAVTISVASEATARDHQRWRTGAEDLLCGEVIEGFEVSGSLRSKVQGSRFKVRASRILSFEGSEDSDHIEKILHFVQDMP